MAKRISINMVSRRVCAVATLQVLLSTPAYAQVDVDLPSQALGTTLVQLAGKMGVNILAPAALIGGKQAPAISGHFTLNDALERLLSGSGLKAVRRGDNTYVIEQGLPSQSAPSAAPTRADTVLPTIQVRAGASADNFGFVSDFTSAATRTDTPIALIPQAIDVVNQAQIESRNAQSVSDALAYLSGMTISNYGNVNVTPYVRGFIAPVMVDGNASSLGLMPRIGALGIPIDGIEKIEVLRGADTILAGSMDAGGVVNITTKQPTAMPVRQLTTQAGSFGDLKQAIDLGGALDGDKRLTYRFVMSAERTGASSYGYNGAKSFYVAPSIGWKSPGTQIVLGFRHLVQDLPQTPTTLFGFDGAPVKVALPSSQPGAMLIQSDDVEISVKHRLSDVFSIESNATYTHFRERADSVGYLPTNFDTPPQTALFYTPVGDRRVINVTTDNRMKAEFSTGEIKQTALVGLQYSVNWGDSSTAVDSISVIAPFPSPVLPPYSGALVYDSLGRSQFTNVYLQDQLSWRRLHITASIARANAWTPGEEAQHAWLPNLGILYELTDRLSVYASTMRSFYPQRGYLIEIGGEPPPYSGHSIETGIKMNLLDDRLTLTADVFRAQTATVIQRIPGTDLVNEQGGQVSRGVEVSAVGRLLPGLNVNANYAYNDVQKGVGLPHHSGTAWLSYDLQDERWAGWGAGIGVIARTATPVWGTTYRLPGQARTDLGIWYHAKGWSTALAVKNAFNRVLYDSAAGSAAYLQPGRLFYLTARYDI
ncbi:TonB-dependent siderophore receptor [Burkholderia lata]|uniref:TonB-dependent siderophore receptor n=1 Tax=Burkholderia lata (strain ATCC 17760 / DSM 23089 / LMG 22485 / NCIMB 9086 / R18194 / 383) TaxID=482957 RepID=UPI0014535C58|nr:TonB-dependent receptor [Burkholderia lata]VWC48920.1 TonB-dependent siderophore receptor [Burkholderia lata]